jgi:hypothetical protein
VLKEGEVERLVSSIDVFVDEVEVSGEVHQKMASLLAFGCFTQVLDVFGG